MKLQKSGKWVLWYQHAGFALIIAVRWLVELTGATSLIFGGEPQPPNWRYPVFVTLLVGFVWAVSYLFTRRLVSHLLYLEGFLRVCSWCRKIGHEDDWMPLEKYFEKGFRVETTHGVCPECLEKAKEETAHFHRSQILKQTIIATPPSPPPPENQRAA